MIVKWKEFNAIQLRKRLLQHQSIWLHNTRLLSFGFNNWKTQYLNSLEEQAKTNIALWQWSLVLQRKVLVAWVAYTADKKRKQARFEVAMATRRKRLLRDGAAQWLSVASYLASEREKFAAQKQAQNAFTSYQIVHRCAMKWRQKTHDRRNARPSKKHNLKQNKLIQPPVPHPSSTEPLMSVKVDPAQEVGLASIDRLLSGLRGRQRPQPRRPAFLMDSLQKEGLWQDPITPSEGLWQDPITPNERKVEDSSNAMFITEHSPERYTQTEHKLTVVEDELIDSGFVRRDKGDTKDKQPQRLPTFMEAPVKKQSLPQRGSVHPNKASVGSKPVLIPPSVFMKPPAHKDHTTVVAKQKSHLRQLSSSDDSSDNRDDEPPGLPVPHHQPVTPPLRTSFEVTSPSWASSVRDETSPHGNQERKPHPKSELVLLPPDAFISGKKHQESSERLTLQQELEDIRDKLKTFQQLKSKLRSLKEQDKQLTEWLKNQDSSADCDLEIQDVIDELHESEMEIKELEIQIQFEKPGAMKLATRAQELIKQVE
ncbi:uncharacterized protein [Antedon mediterranea]|uniref:uncharacterized protein n=1 Tax=Antedon mediterranea TaxID=105859 RepID=UPI003AF9E577